MQHRQHRPPQPQRCRPCEASDPLVSCVLPYAVLLWAEEIIAFWLLSCAKCCAALHVSYGLVLRFVISGYNSCCCTAYIVQDLIKSTILHTTFLFILQSAILIEFLKRHQAITDDPPVSVKPSCAMSTTEDFSHIYQPL